MSSQEESSEAEQKIREGAEVWNAWRKGKEKDALSLHNANLVGFSFTGHNLTDIDFRQARLQYTDFSKASGLRDLQFSGADLTGALLPEGFQFFGLDSIAETSKQARFLLFFLISGCLFSLMAIKGITDVELITNSGKVQLPFVQAHISSKYFIFVAPGLVAILFFYFHLYLQYLWRELGNQPNYFPDGRSLDEKAYPWLVNGLFKPNNKDHGSGLFIWLRITTAKAMTWWIAPGTLVFMELFFLRRQDDWATVTQLALISGVMVYSSATYSYMINARTHRGKQYKWYWTKNLKLPLSIVIVLALFSSMVLKGPKLCDTFYPNVYKEELSKRKDPSEWEKFSDEDKLKKIHEVRLVNRNLRFLQAEGADFYGGKLSGANLHGANLDSATLIGVDLTNANLTDSYLTNVSFVGGSLDYANMERSTFSFIGVGPSMKMTNLSHAKSPKWIMPGSELEGIIMRGFSSTNMNLSHSNLKSSDLSSAILKSGSNSLSYAKLIRANLTGAKMDGIDLRNANMFRAILKDGVFSGAKLQYAQLRQAVLDGASFRNADLTDTWLSGASTKGTDFSGAILTNCKGLSITMLKAAKINQATILPPEFEEMRSELMK